MTGEHLKKLAHANIATLVVAVLTLVWNWAVLSTQAEHMREDINSLTTNQRTLVVLTEQLAARVNSLEELKADVERLERLHLGPSSTLPAPTETFLTPPVLNPPKRGVDLLDVLP